MKVFQNGQIITEVEGWDRGLQFGDGLFETIRISNGNPVAFQFHEARLNTGMQRLGFPAEAEANHIISSALDAFLGEANSNTGMGDGVLKVIVTRGNSSRGYRPPQSAEINTTAFFSDLASYPKAFYQDGIKVGFCQTQAAIQPQLAGLKHLNRLDCVLAASEVASKDGEWQEGFMLNDLGFVIEGTMSNVFVKIDGQWITPKLDRSGVAGTMRQRIIERADLDVTVRDVSKSEFNSVSSMFVCNSLIGIWPVSDVDGRALTIPREITSLIKQWQSAEF